MNVRTRRSTRKCLPVLIDLHPGRCPASCHRSSIQIGSRCATSAPTAASAGTVAGSTSPSPASANTLALEEIDDGIWNVYFGALRLGRLDERNMRIEDAYGRLFRHRTVTCWTDCYLWPLTPPEQARYDASHPLTATNMPKIETARNIRCKEMRKVWQEVCNAHSPCRCRATQVAYGFSAQKQTEAPTCSICREWRGACSVVSNDLVERPRAGAHDRAVYRSRPLQRRVSAI
jgi:hypothetical protein